ncbi:MAG: hypothetical protein J7K35_03985 [Syntrophobacterales bacterium]|nr:hypothetical protein [Syntrophobacterales bacterium]
MTKLIGNENILLKYIDIEKIGQILVIAIVLIFTLKFFQSTPFERIFFQLQAVFLVLTALFLVSYVVITLLKKDCINEVVIYFLILISIIPFYSMCRASAEFGQPFIYGLLSERAWLLIGVGIWFYYVIITRKINLATIESAFVFMAWASLVIFSLFVLLYNPGQLAYKSHFVHMDAIRGLRFKFQMYFIIFGAVYYFVKYAVHENLKYLVILLFFLAYLLFIHQGRITIMALAATFLLYYWLNYSLSKLAILSIKLSLFLLVALIAIQIIMPDYLDRMSYLFAQMVRVLTGKMSQDPSANSRILQSQMVLNYFDNHPFSLWLGAGRVSHQWNGGYRSLFSYFYPSDLGVLGGLFLYGILGLVFVLIIPVIISIKTLRRVPEKGNVFIKTLKYLLVFAIIRAIQGSFYFGPMVYIISLFILLAYNDLEGKADAN